MQALETGLAAAIECDQGRFEVCALCYPLRQFSVQGLGIDQRLSTVAQRSEMLGQPLQSGFGALREDPAIVDRADRETMVVMGNFQHAVVLVEGQRDLALLQGCAVVAAKEGQQ
ncbi:hypothetical protein D3C81_1602850 [compost metagenome]